MLETHGELTWAESRDGLRLSGRIAPEFRDDVFCYLLDLRLTPSSQ